MSNEFIPFNDALEESVEKSSAIGTNYSQLDALNQGIYSRYFGKNNIGLMPLIGAGRVDNALEKVNHGQIEIIGVDPYYSDKDSTWNPVEIIQTGRVNFGIRLEGVLDVEDSLIEPLSIRKEATFKHIESPFLARNFSAQLMDGNEDEWRYSSQIVYWDCHKDEVDIFEDSTNLLLPTDVTIFNDNVLFPKDVYFALPGWVSDRQTSVRPFVDDGHNEHFGFDYLNKDLKNFVDYDKMPGRTDEMMPICSVGAAAGFIHPESHKMTDSIVYSGYKNSMSVDTRRDAARTSDIAFHGSVTVVENVS